MPGASCVSSWCAAPRAVSTVDSSRFRAGSASRATGPRSTPRRVEVLAELPVLETRTTNFRIAPFLARVTPPERWSPAPAEVAEVIEVKVADLVRPEAHGESVERFPTWPEPRTIGFYRVGPHRLWGATYRILQPLLPRLAAGEW
jgi:hypothetical protein